MLFSMIGMVLAVLWNTFDNDSVWDYYIFFFLIHMFEACASLSLSYSVNIRQLIGEKRHIAIKNKDKCTGNSRSEDFIEIAEPVSHISMTRISAVSAHRVVRISIPSLRHFVWPFKSTKTYPKEKDEQSSEQSNAPMDYLKRDLNIKEET